MKWEKFQGIWDYYVKEPHLSKDIWSRKPMPV
jgi:hypothetical protein